MPLHSQNYVIDKKIFCKDNFIKSFKNNDNKNIPSKMFDGDIYLEFLWIIYKILSKKKMLIVCLIQL